MIKLKDILFEIKVVNPDFIKPDYLIKLYNEIDNEIDNQEENRIYDELLELAKKYNLYISFGDGDYTVRLNKILELNHNELRNLYVDLTSFKQRYNV